MIGHTVDRCFELIGYPPGMEKRSVGQSGRNNVGNRSNQSAAPSSSVASALPFTSEQITKLMSLIGEKSEGEQLKSNMGGESSYDLKSKKILVIGSQDNGLYFVGRHGFHLLC
uniref:Uncharacterized protein n=1 Tax=Helianthus annuus TaxID=4232 RepID=A0A251ULP1_HELAN